MEHYKFFQNNKCEYFPCHKNKDDQDFNCLFCYCPLYALKEQCGGNYEYLENGVKSCKDCILPHTKNGYDFIRKRINMIIELGKK